MNFFTSPIYRFFEFSENGQLWEERSVMIVDLGPEKMAQPVSQIRIRGNLSGVKLIAAGNSA